MPKVILIVDEDISIRSLIGALVRDYGYCVIEAANSQEAVSKAEEKLPDLLLIDISDESLKTLSAVRTIKLLADCREIPVIALTRYRNNHFQQAIEAGCNDLLEKPLDFTTLKFLLNLYLD